MKCTKLIFYRTYCMPCWEIVQIKYKDPAKPKEPVVKDYLFIDDSNDNYVEEESSNFKLLKVSEKND